MTPTTLSLTGDSAVIARAESLKHHIAAAADAIERDRRLPRAVVAWGPGPQVKAIQHADPRQSEAT